MKGLIVAGGRSSRMGDISGLNKCAIHVGGKPIVRRIVDSLKENNVHDIHVVAGTSIDSVNEALKGTEVITSDVRGGILKAIESKKEEIDDEIIFSMGDNVFHDSVMPKFLESKGDVVIAINDQVSEDNDVKVEVVDGKIKNLEEHWPIERTHGDFCRLVKLSPKAAKRMFELTSEHINDESKKTRFIDVLNSLAKEFDVIPHFIPVNSSVEVDTPEDLSEAQKIADDW